MVHEIIAGPLDGLYAFQELHTLGVDGGYTQEDVLALASILTGWTVDLEERPSQAERAGFFPERHEPGPMTLLGKTYAQDGPDQAVAALADLAPSRHPVPCHAPNGPALRRARAAGAGSADGGGVPRHRGRSRRRHAALVMDDEVWVAPRKVRPPLEFLLASARLLGGLPPRPGPRVTLSAMGQPFWAAPSPKGWPAKDDPWAAPDAINTAPHWS
ncbi:DUF1800 family protein [Roseomonas sp. GCM10028921]